MFTSFIEKCASQILRKRLSLACLSYQSSGKETVLKHTEMLFYTDEAFGQTNHDHDERFATSALFLRLLAVAGTLEE
jgi:hypothetical protein